MLPEDVRDVLINHELRDSLLEVVLDLGCGSGTFLATLLSEFPGTQGIGLTLSPDAQRLTCMRDA